MNIKNKEFEVYGSFTATSAKEDGTIKIAGYANTVDKDRAGDIILADAWNTKNALGNYLDNPIILAFHDHAKPMGKMINHRVDAKGLYIEAEIYDDGSAAFRQIKNGVLKTFSVGFRCLDADYKDNSDTFVIKDLELLEVSVVSVPCNQSSTFDITKAITSSISVPAPAYTTEQLSIRDAILKDSEFLTALATINVGAKTGLQGYFNADGTAIMHEKNVTRSLGVVKKILTSETKEDANIDLVTPMETAMKDTARLDIENKLAAMLVAKAGTATTGSASKSWAAVLDMYKSLAPKVRNATGQLYCFCSDSSAIEITESTSYFQSNYKDKIKVIGITGFSETSIVLAHSFGIFGRVELNRGIEVTKLLPSDATQHILGYGYGLEVDEAYVVKKAVSLNK